MRRQPKGRFQVQEEVEHDEELSDVVSDVDSDEELAVAFEEGRLQPGLNTIVPFKKKIIFNNLVGLNAKLNDVKQDFDWIERLDLTNEPAEITEEMQEQFGDIEFNRTNKGEVENGDPSQNDFKREMLFFRQAQAAILEGIPKLKKLGVKTQRPSDYFAQTLKTDAHMARIQSNLKGKQEVLEKSEKAKKLREMKKMGKKIQHEVLLNRQKEKREMLEKVKAYKKGKINTLDLDQKPKKGILKKGGRNDKLNRKQMKKNETYGFGGQKKRSKSNDAESFANEFNMKRPTVKSQRGQGLRRLGKNRRQQDKKRR